jgi:transcriptional regulator GlxA family with amidase domain
MNYIAPIATSCENSASLTPAAELVIALVPGFSQLSVSAFVEPLHIANMLIGEEAFKWRMIGETTASLQSSSGFTTVPSGTYDSESKRISRGESRGELLIFSGEGIQAQISQSMLRLVRACVRARVPIAAVGSASFVLAQAGLLRGAKCTVHWPLIPALAEKFSELEVENAIFVMNGRVSTCAGELASFDLSIDLISRRVGDEVARKVCALLLADKWRKGEHYQSAPASLINRPFCKSLAKTIVLMESAIENKMSINLIARRSNLSRRQIERLFRKHLNTTPRRYQSDLRLDRAADLVKNTDMTLTEIALKCGFETQSHFAKCFRERFKLSASTMRQGCLN